MNDSEIVEKRLNNAYPVLIKAWAVPYLRDHYTQELIEQMIRNTDEYQMKCLAKHYLTEVLFWYTTEERANLEKSLTVAE